MEKATDKLVHEIKSVKNIDNYIEVNASSLKETHFVDFLNKLLNEKNIKRSELIAKSNLSKQYIYELFSKKQIKPSKDTVIKICIGLGTSLEEANRLLQMAGYSHLYPKIKRDSIIMFCILNNFNIIESNLLLDEKGVAVL